MPCRHLLTSHGYFCFRIANVLCFVQHNIRPSVLGTAVTVRVSTSSQLFVRRYDTIPRTAPRLVLFPIFVIQGFFHRSRLACCNHLCNTFVEGGCDDRAKIRRKPGAQIATSRIQCSSNVPGATMRTDLISVKPQRHPERPLLGLSFPISNPISSPTMPPTFSFWCSCHNQRDGCI